MTEPFPKFKTMDEMLAHYYPASSEEIQKADDPLLTSTTGWYNAVYGAKVWQQLNYEKNVFAILAKAPWRQSGWRVESEYASALTNWPIGGIAENAAPLTSESLKPDWVEISIGPKSIWNHFEASDVATFLSTVDDSVDAIAEMREALGKFHTSQLNEMLMTHVDTLAGNNIESLDRVVSNYDEVTNCGITAGDSDIYGIDRDAAASWADAVVNHNSDTDHILTLALIDATLKDIWQNGGNPKVILTGYDTLMEWQGLLEAQRRFMPSTDLKMTSFKGVQAATPGVEAGFAVSMYHGIPIIPTHRCTTGGSGISHIFFLDTDHIHIKMAKPTQYIEQRDPLAIDRFGMVGGFYTMAELICTNFKSQGKIRDLVAA